MMDIYSRYEKSVTCYYGMNQLPLNCSKQTIEDKYTLYVSKVQ